MKKIGNITIDGAELTLNLASYDNGRPAVTVLFQGMPWSRLTINLPDQDLAEGEIIVKTWGENQKLRAHALATGLFTDTGRRVETGFCTAEIWTMKLPPMQAYLIDPIAKTITVVEHAGGLESIYAHLQCGMVDAIRLPTGDAIYIDDEGLLAADPEAAGFFAVNGHPHPVAGRGLVVGTTSEGDDADPAASLVEITNNIRFLSPK